MLLQKASTENSKTVRVLNVSLEAIRHDYENSTNGTNRMIMFALRARKMIHNEVKGVFSKNELHAMLDNENGTMIELRYWGNKQMFMYSLEDGVKYDGLDKRWEVDFESIKEKIDKLSDVAFLYLHESIYCFWNESVSYGSPAPSMEKFIKDFTKQ